MKSEEPDPRRLPEALARLESTFAAPRPATFVRDPRHCDECAEHEQVLAGTALADLALDELGHPGWDPVCFVSDEAFAYLLPALVRLGLGGRPAPYLPQLVFHLQSRFDWLDALEGERRAALSEVLAGLLAETPPHRGPHDEAADLAAVLDRIG